MSVLTTFPVTLHEESFYSEHGVDLSRDVDPGGLGGFMDFSPHRHFAP